MSSEESVAYEVLAERDGLAVSRSPWGTDDQIGRLNWVTPESRAAVLAAVDGTALLDLSVDYFVGMPSWVATGEPKFDRYPTTTPRGKLNELDGDGGVFERYSVCGDAITMGVHCGTHIDTLNHCGHFGCFWNGWTPERDMGSCGWLKGGAENYPPIFARGVLLDVAGAHGVDCLPEAYAIGADELCTIAADQRTELRRGDVVLVRTGRMTRWPDFEAYMTNPPGIGLAAARFLCEEAGAMCVGADNVGLEVMPMEDPETLLPVHCYMFATAGAQIIEVLWLEELAAERRYEFAFLGFPLRLRGATGAPMRAAAVALRA
jgi:kynurenine formamidase